MLVDVSEFWIIGVNSFALDDATVLGLGMVGSIAKAAKSSAGREGEIVLGKGVSDVEVSEFSVVVRFYERAVRTAMDQRAQFTDRRQRGCDSLHLHKFYACCLWVGNFEPEPAIALSVLSRSS